MNGIPFTFQVDWPGFGVVVFKLNEFIVVFIGDCNFFTTVSQACLILKFSKNSICEIGVSGEKCLTVADDQAAFARQEVAGFQLSEAEVDSGTERETG